MMKSEKFVIGIDFGTDSVRTVIVDTKDGREISSHVYYYPRWSRGKYCNPAANQFRQHPLDYIEGLEITVKEAVSMAPGGTADRICGISVDTTGSTPVAVDRKGSPLALLPEFSENPNAMFILWKDHTAVSEAMEITRHAKSWKGTDYTMFEGGIYSSEWFWAKMLHVLRTDPGVRRAAFSWIEHCDWIPGLLTGTTDPLTLKRSRCAAGHKAMWHGSFDGLPSEEFLAGLDPLLKGVRGRLFRETYTSDISAGNLSSEWAERLGLDSSVRVGVGAFDAHMGAVGGQIKPYTLTKIMGTSTCDMLVAPKKDVGERTVAGICGQVDGSIIPGLVGLEAGQSAFGDVYAWFRDLLSWPLSSMDVPADILDGQSKAKVADYISANIITELSRRAEGLPINESGVVALDWLNGRRTPDANQLLQGALTGLTLGTDAPRIFRGLVEATAFGAKRIVERFKSEGVKIEGVIALGGVAKKSPFIMKVVADVLNMPIRVPRSEQTCALGAAMFAATVAGVYSSVDEAMNQMGSGFEEEYLPDPRNAEKYAVLYNRYLKTGEFVEKEIMNMEESK